MFNAFGPDTVGVGVGTLLGELDGFELKLISEDGPMMDEGELDILNRIC